MNRPVTGKAIELILGDVLPELYPDVHSTQRVVARAGLQPARVALGPVAINNWYTIVEEARRQGLLLQLVEVALADYPQARELWGVREMLEG